MFLRVCVKCVNIANRLTWKRCKSQYALYKLHKSTGMSWSWHPVSFCCDRRTNSSIYSSGLILLWYNQFYVFSLCHQIFRQLFFKESSAAEMGTSCASMNQTAKSNAKKGPEEDYNAYKDFIDRETEAHIVSRWMVFAGIAHYWILLVNCLTKLGKHIINFSPITCRIGLTKDL